MGVAYEHLEGRSDVAVPRTLLPMAYKMLKRNQDRRKLALRNARARTFCFTHHKAFDYDLVLFYQKRLDRNQFSGTRGGLRYFKQMLCRQRRRHNRWACYLALVGDELAHEASLCEGQHEEFDWLVW